MLLETGYYNGWTKKDGAEYCQAEELLHPAASHHSALDVDVPAESWLLVTCHLQSLLDELTTTAQVCGGVFVPHHIRRTFLLAYYCGAVASAAKVTLFHPPCVSTLHTQVRNLLNLLPTLTLVFWLRLPLPSERLT